MNNALASLFSWASVPVLLTQGLWVRLNSMRLGPAEGPLNGQFGEDNAPPIRILVVGDSSAAGIGLKTTDGVIACQLARKLHAKHNVTVSWRTSGHNSATAGQIRDHVVPHLSPEPYTHIFIMLGTNDMKNFHTARRWKKEFGTLIYALNTRFPDAEKFWHQAIDLSGAPALPQPLATVLNWRRAILNNVGAKLCNERGVVLVPPLPGVTAEGFCKDGFHANAYGYGEWAEHFIEHISH